MTSPVHALSVDVEDWSNVTLLLNYGRVVPPQPAVVRNTERLLELFLSRGASATWFVLGEVAAAFPDLVVRLASAGQEVGVHGYHHHLVYTLTRDQFRDSLQRAKDTIEQLTGRPVLGYRATAFSINRTTPWAFEVLAELGFRYDSSVFPFGGRRYGDPAASLGRFEHATRSGALTEIPMTVLAWGRLRLPCCGGGYLRHFPLAYTRLALRVLERQNRTAVFYLHPYEIDTKFETAFFEQHLGAGVPSRFSRMRYLQFRNRHQTETKLDWLLRRRRFGGLAEVFALAPSRAGNAAAP